MVQFTTLIFDFDGTIADSLETLLRIYNAIAPRLGCRRIAPGKTAELRQKRPQDFLRDYGVTAIKLPVVVLCIRYLLRRNMHKIRPVDGIPPALLSLQAREKRLGIVTSNSLRNLDLFLNKWIVGCAIPWRRCGSSLLGKHKLLEELIRKNHLSLSQTVYIGDEVRDIEAAHAAGCASIAVSWGYHDREMLRASNPDLLIDAPHDLTML
jgi:phosphoglycolate phosphatase